MSVKMNDAVALLGLFAVGFVLIVTRRAITAMAGYKVMAIAVVGFPLLSAIGRLIHSPLPTDAALQWRAFDILVSVVELLLSAAAVVWIVRARSTKVDE
jgi:uncharacterized membrane protein YecN with MAPEG domain